MLAQQRHDIGHVVAGELSARVDAFAQAVDARLDASADAIARLQDEHRRTARDQRGGGRQAGEPGAYDDDVMHGKQSFFSPFTGKRCRQADEGLRQLRRCLDCPSSVTS